MAVVYRATDVRLDRLVALKVLAPELTRDSAFRQRFIRESALGRGRRSSQRHPGLRGWRGRGRAVHRDAVRGRPGRPGADRAGGSAADRPAWSSIVTQIASALDTAHAHGLVHRDVKPANMLLGSIASGSAPDHVYLSDFGLSKHVGLGGQPDRHRPVPRHAGLHVARAGRGPADRRRAPTSTRLPARPSRCSPAGRRSSASQNLAVMWAQVSAPPPSVREFRPGLPAEVDRVIAKALAKAPDDRHASCLAFATDLRTACVARQAGEAGPPGAPTELAATAKPVPPATELAAHPPVGTGHPHGAAGPPAYEATITEAAVGGAGVAPGGAGGSGARTPGATAADRQGGNAYSPPGGYDQGGYQSGYGQSAHGPAGSGPSGYGQGGYGQSG